MIAMRGYFKRNQRRTTSAKPQSPIQPHRASSRSLPSTFNRATTITSTRRRVRTADHGIESPSKSVLQLSSEGTGAHVKESTPRNARKRAATLLQTIHTRAIRGSPKIGFGNGSGSKASLDSFSTTARKAFSPRLGLGQFSPRLELGQFPQSFTIEESPKKEDGSLGVEKSPVYMNSWSSALQLDPFHSPKRDTNSVSGVERPISPTPNKARYIGRNKTMSASELFLPASPVNEPGTSAVVDKSGVSSDRYDHAGNFGFMDQTSMQSGLNTQVTPQAPVVLTRAESYAERTNQLGVALLTSPINMHTKPANRALGITFDSFFSPVTERPSPEPRYGEVSSERMVKVGHSQETLTTAYVTASESGVSPGAENGYKSPSTGHGIPEHAGVVGSPITLRSQIAELDSVATPLFVVDPDTTAAFVEETSNQLPTIGSSSNSLSVEYGRADRSLRALDSFPAMLRGSLSCFPEDVSLNTPMMNTPVLPSAGTGRRDLTHREASDIMLLPADDLTQGCLVLTRVGEDSAEHDGIVGASSDASALPFDVTQEVSSLAARSEEESILSPDLSERTTEQTDSIISCGRDSNMRSSVDSIMVGQYGPEDWSTTLMD
jgi:hypothetical protein